MKSIIIKSMRLTNFKGVRDLSLDFSDRMTNIYGRNGSGKTTIFDAFTWLLFGKDSSDRKAFDIKTLDEQGNIIPQLPHEVTAVIEVNGVQTTLTRRYTEKWVKRAGQSEKTFDGNKEERFFNDVPCGEKEYNAKIAEICNEDVFKFITSPTYFTSQKWEAQKSMLEKMAGNITDAEVAGDNQDFVELLNAITGKSLTEVRKEINAKKSRINAELIALPGNIEENKRKQAKYDAEDFDALDAELAQKRKARAEIERQLDDINERQRVKSDARKKEEAELQKIQNDIFARRHEVQETFLHDYYEERDKQNALKNKRKSLLSEIASQKQTITNYQREIAACESKRETLLGTYRNLNEQQKAIAAETLLIDETQFVCPTCKRPLDIADIEKKEAELQKNFNADKEQRLQRVSERIEQNKADGRANNERKQYCQKMIDEAQAKIDEAQKQVEEISAGINDNLVAPDATAAIEADERLKKLQREYDTKDAELKNVVVEAEDTSELKDGRATLTAAIEELVARSSKRADAEENRQRLAELEKRMKTQNEELAALERKEFILAEFSKARSAAIESRINGLFRIVRFRWEKVAINGSVSETCEAIVNGVPYASLNNAGQINAGLDIINAICRSYDICAPIFIDNAESINDIIPMQSQIINLVVSRDERLRVEAQQ